NQVRGHGQRVTEARAPGGDVEGGRAVHAEVGGDARGGGGGEQQVGGGGDDDAVDLVGGDLGRGHRVARGGHAHGVQCLGLVRETPGPDARSGPDPFVARVDGAGDLVVGDDPGRAIDAEPE